MTSLICSVCQKPFSHKNPRTKGCSVECRKKVLRVYLDQYRLDHLETYRAWVRDGVKRWRSTMTPDRKKEELEKNYEWRNNNPERWKELKRKDYEAHPETAKRSHIKRKHSVRAAGEFPPHDVIKHRMGLLRGCCYCGKQGDLTLEHVVPLSKGGTNEPVNLLGACWKCNVSKNNKNWLEWFLTKPFYSLVREIQIRSLTASGV